MKKPAGHFLDVWVAACSAFLFFGCAASYIHPQYSDPGFSIDSLKGVKSLLVVSNHVDVREYRRSFEKAYRDGDHFSDHFSNVLADSLNKPGSGFSIRIGPPEISAGLESPRLDHDTISHDTVSGFRDSLRSMDAKYIIHVKNIVISNEMQYNPGVYAPSGPTGGMMMTGGGTSESCVLFYEVEIWDSGTMTRKTSFAVSGKAGTFLFFYQTALENAVWNSAVHLIGYLRNGKTDF